MGAPSLRSLQGPVRRCRQRRSYASDKVQVMRTVTAMQADGHKPMLQAAPYPPLHNTQGRGTHSSVTGRKTNPQGWATRRGCWMSARRGNRSTRWLALGRPVWIMGCEQSA